MIENTPTPLEQLLHIAMGRKSITLGLPAINTRGDHRFALTPEGAAMLIDRGITVFMEHGAGRAISYSDIRYQHAGVHIVTHEEALATDIVLHLSPISADDAEYMRRGAMLLTMFNPATHDPLAVQTLLEKHITSIALDLVKDGNSKSSFADIINEIDGRASIAVATSILANRQYGKGILLGGVAGIIPCEVLIIGAGIAGIAAARSALGLGALVHLFDDNIYRLRKASETLGSGLATSALHPHVLTTAARSADVVIATHVDHPCVFSEDVMRITKPGVIIFNLDKSTNIFPSLPIVNLRKVDNPAAHTSPGRVCFVNVAGTVPRTSAMALSNSLVTMFDDIFSTGGGIENAIKLMPGLQCAALTFSGRVVNARLASNLGLRHVDINLLLQFS